MNFLLSVLVLVGTTISATPLTDDIARRSTALQNLAAAGEAAHASRCSRLGSCLNGNTACSVPACGYDFPTSKGFHCNSTFGTDSVCSCRTGLWRSMTNGVVRVAPGTDFSDPETQAFVCTTTNLDTDFKRNLDSRTLDAWQYIGGAQGAIRIYPGAAQSRATDKCGTYDPRLRPWYIAASSGPKDIVIVIDKSGSMTALNSQFASSNSETRMDAVKTAVSALLDTLTQNDFVSVVTFSSTAQALGSFNGLVRATAANVATLKQLVSSVTATGTTNFVPAFEKGFEMMRTSHSGDQTSSCTRMMLFLTDGIASESSSAISATIAAEQARLGAGRKAHIFTYSMSSGASDSIPQEIACANNGVWARISDGEDPLTQMAQYYQFQAAAITSTTVRWTTPYIDAFGLGSMVTAARPVYDRSQSVPLLVGVVGTDITMQSLEAHADSSTVINALIAASSSCPNVTLSDCQLQHLRQATGFVCPSPATTIATCNARNEIVTVSKCTSTGSLNSMLCTGLDTTSRLPASGTFRSTSAATCCASSCSGPANSASDYSGSGSSPSTGSATPSPTSDDGGGTSIIIILVVLAIVVGGIALAVFIVYKFFIAKPAEESAVGTTNTNNAGPGPKPLDDPPQQQHGGGGPGYPGSHQQQQQQMQYPPPGSYPPPDAPPQYPDQFAPPPPLPGSINAPSGYPQQQPSAGGYPQPTPPPQRV